MDGDYTGMSEAEAMGELARLLWERYMKPRAKDELLNHSLDGYKAQVISNNEDGTLTVLRPFDAVSMTLRCPPALAEAAEAGDQVLVIQLGDASNGFILCGTDMSGFGEGTGFRPVSFDFSDIANGFFTETVEDEGGTQVTTIYDVTFDTDGRIDSVTSRTDGWGTTVEWGEKELLPAADVSYDNTGSGLSAGTVQAALSELAAGRGSGSISPYESNPAMDGTASPGSSADYARGDHVHPTDNSRAAASLEINGHPLTGDFDLDASDVGLGNVADERQYSAQNPPPYPVTSVNGATGDVMVAVPAAYTSNPTMDGTASPGSSTLWARGDHVHPTDNSRAPAGYGLGVKLGTLTPIADANDTTLMTGWYATSATPTDTQNLPSGLSGDDKVGALYIAARGEYVYQEFYCNRRNLVYSRLRGWGGSGYAWTQWQVEASIDPANPFATEQQIAYVETGSTASRAYAVGEYFCWNGLLYRVTAAISSGAAFTAGTNCVAQTVGAALTGKAPAGYGLGVMTRDIGTSVTDCNNIDVTGWFDVAAGASNRPSGLSATYPAVIYSTVRGPLYSYQEYYDYNTGKVYRRFKNTTWSSWVQI